MASDVSFLVNFDDLCMVTLYELNDWTLITAVEFHRN